MGKWLERIKKQEPEPKEHSVVTQISDYDKYRLQIRRRGYAAMKSDALGGEVIYIARDEKAAMKCPAGAAVYTESDLAELTKNAPDRQQLKIINEAKKAFRGGRIIDKGAVDCEQAGK